MSETPCKYFLHSKSSFNSLYTLNLLFLHIPECKLLITKFLNALFILNTASLEPSEVGVRSTSLIISKTHFFHCFIFLPGILHLFHSFSKFFLQKLSLPFFNTLENQTTFLLFLLKFKGSIPKSPHTASLQVFEEQPKIFLHAANNTASNALDWDVQSATSCYMHEQHLSYPVILPLNHLIQQNHLQTNEGKDETLLSISFIKPSTKIRNNVGDRVQPCATP